jgi:hypothetical protein
MECHVDQTLDSRERLGVVGYIDAVPPGSGAFSVWAGSHLRVNSLLREGAAARARPLRNDLKGVMAGSYGPRYTLMFCIDLPQSVAIQYGITAAFYYVASTLFPLLACQCSDCALKNTCDSCGVRMTAELQSIIADTPLTVIVHETIRATHVPI